MPLPDRILTRTLEPVEFGGSQLFPEVYEKPDEYPVDGEAKQMFYLTERQKRLTKDHLKWQDLTRTSFNQLVDGTAIFTGINIGKRMRGTGLSKLIFGHTIEYLEQEGYYVAETAKIRKPQMALMLKREGWRPLSIKCEAEILPDIIIESSIPTIRILANCIPESQIKTRSAHGLFYHEAPDHLLEDRAVDQEHVIHLHTPFIPPEPESLAS